jgi:hypothetical protein
MNSPSSRISPGSRSSPEERSSSPRNKGVSKSGRAKGVDNRDSRGGSSSRDSVSSSSGGNSPRGGVTSFKSGIIIWLTLTYLILMMDDFKFNNFYMQQPIALLILLVKW